MKLEELIPVENYEDLIFKYCFILDEKTHSDAREFIKIIQKHSWNAAIKWAGENVEITKDSAFNYMINEESILKGLID